MPLQCNRICLCLLHDSYAHRFASLANRAVLKDRQVCFANIGNVKMENYHFSST